MRIPLENLIDWGCRFLRGREVPADTAGYLARLIVETEAFRRATHGLEQFEHLDSSLGNELDPEREARIVTEGAATAVFDGERCIGDVVAKQAREEAVRRARRQGTGFVIARNTGWVGALGMHLIPVAQAGMLTYAWAQAAGWGDCAPYGGFEPRFSTNPIAFALPTDGDPIAADFSAATMSAGKTEMLIHEGKKTDEPRFLDALGNPSCDPNVFHQGGTIMFTGRDEEGYKGFALAIFNEALAILGGGTANHPEAPTHQSLALMVLDPTAFEGREHYLKVLKHFVGHIKGSRVRERFDGIRLPGERGFAALRDARESGVPVDERKRAILRRVAERNGMPVPWEER